MFVMSVIQRHDNKLMKMKSTRINIAIMKCKIIIFKSIKLNNHLFVILIL